MKTSPRWLLAAAAFAFVAAPANACGVERWSVKTLTDSAAARVNFRPIATTISRLAAIPSDEPLLRECPFECRTYRVTAQLTSYKIEADGDVHMVLFDAASNETMIAEIPSVGCVAGARGASTLRRVRRNFDARFHPSRRWHDSGLIVRATGVGFLDRIHGQRGVAENGVELHPLTGLRIVP